MPSESRRSDTGLQHKFSIVGIGPGAPSLRTKAAEEAIKSADFVVGYRPYLELIDDLLPGKKVFSSSMGKEVDRVQAAVDLLGQGSVALVSSGDPNVYGMAGLGLELAVQPAEVQIVPGVTSFTAAACRAGLAFRECVAVISLSDLLTPWQEIEGRLRLAAESEMPVALYNPRSKRRDWQLIRALDICGQRNVLVAKNIGREGEELFWTTSARLMERESLREKIDMTTLVIVCGRGRLPGRCGPEAGVNLVGIGPGDPRQPDPRGREHLEELGEDLRGREIPGADRRPISGREGDPLRPLSGEMIGTACREARELWQRQGKKASILTGGDPSIFGSGWRIMDLAQEMFRCTSLPGVSAFSSVAARAGAPLVNDFALLSRPGRRRPGSPCLAAAGFGVVVYNVKGHEIAALLAGCRSTDGLCVLARDVAREGEEMMI